MEKKQDYLSIQFDLKAPEDPRHSVINTIVLLLGEIKEMEDWQQQEEFDTIVFNDKIEQIKKELDNLKILEIKNDNI